LEDDMTDTSIHPAARIGHVQLRVDDLDRALCFYRELIGLAVTLDGPAVGLPGVAFLAAGDHHHLALNTWQTEGGSQPPQGHIRLHHVAIMLPDRAALAAVTARPLDHGYPLDGAEDHGATVAVYLLDPDGNGLEPADDRPREDSFDASGRPVVKADPFDPCELLAAVDGGEAAARPGRS
jgi:catechol 2,3-dioxygenase